MPARALTTMTMLAVGLLLAALSGCSDRESSTERASFAGTAQSILAANEPPRHPDAEEAVEACRAALGRLGEVAADGRAAVVAEGCSDLFVETACKDAMRRSARVGPERRAAELSRACAGAYCPLLPEPKPRLCAEDLSELGAEALSAAWTPFVARVHSFDLGQAAFGLGDLVTRVSVPVEVPPTVVPGAAIRVAVAGGAEGLEVTFTLPGGGSRSLQTSDESLARDVAAALAGVSREGGAVVAADAGTPRARVVATMDALRAAGFERLSIEATPAVEPGAPMRVSVAGGAHELGLTFTLPDGQSSVLHTSDESLTHDVAEALAGVTREAGAVVAADPDMTYARVVAVMDALRAAGFERLSIEAAPGGGGPG